MIPSNSIAVPAGFAAVSQALREKYKDLGAAAAERLQEWLSGAVPLAYPEVLAQHLRPECVDLLFDSFWQVLPFGTGGRRGRVGYGANRINPSTVAVTIQGHCSYLRKHHGGKPNLAVVVANDVRIFNDIAGTYRFLGGSHPLLGMSSRSFARLACEIYAANGIVSYLAEAADPDVSNAFLSTPELSFLISTLGAVAGTMLSASHNPPDDNGVKLFDEYGGQPVAPDDQELLDTMTEVTDVRSMDFATALGQGLIRPIPKDTHERYVRSYLRLYHGQTSEAATCAPVSFFAPRSDIPIVYTPLSGCGLATAYDVLQRLGFPVKTPPREGPDGTFAEIPFRCPNPEVPESTTPAKQFAETVGADLVLASDPDADRVGVEVRLADRSWRHLDGNQIAAILCYALMLDPSGPRRTGLVIETLVTTRMLGQIVARRGDSAIVENLLVGFKYVAAVLKSLAQSGRYEEVSGRPEQLVLAAEESHGVGMLQVIRDKDATPACMFLAGLHQRLKTEGRNLFDYYLAILEQVGPFDCVNRSLLMLGATGVGRRDQIMASLRTSPPDRMAGEPVTRIVDHWDERVFGKLVSQSDELPRNVLEIHTASFVVIVRPSGTEPKIKFYCHLLSSGIPRASQGLEVFTATRKQADVLALQVYRELMRPVGIELGDLALLLPDIVDVDSKLSFERETVPALRSYLSANRHVDLEKVLAWLRERCASLTPGADPVPALKRPLAAFLAKHGDGSPAALALARWAQT